MWFADLLLVQNGAIHPKNSVNYNREHHGVMRLDKNSPKIHRIKGVNYVKETHSITFSEKLMKPENQGDDAMEFQWGESLR